MRPDIEAAHLPMIPLATGLAAAQAVATTAGVNVDIRWPNDLLIGDRKTGGILVESKSGSGGAIFVIIGIGINVHQQNFDDGLSTPATSLDIESGRAIRRQALLIALLKSLQQEVSGLYDPVIVSAIPARVAQTSTWVWNRQVEVHGPQSCVGITAGLDANGFLLVRTDHGVVTVQTGGIRAAGID
jgi:BirA family biotin operon repressor/biotin-[acetyl-CoA-carboxylase] ligase